jgi:hypothetical protein
VHDTTWFETHGRPAVFVATSAFAYAAVKQSEALGLPEVHRVFVPHPVADATDEEMHAKADAIVDAIVDALVD